MILDRFIEGFGSRFPDVPFEVRGTDSTVVIPGGNPAIERIEIQDDLDELSVFFGSITHGHFGCDDQSLTLQERESEVIREVLALLADVFDGKIEFYRMRFGGGGWRPAGSGKEKAYTWLFVSKI